MAWFKKTRERLLAKEREDVRTSVRELPPCTAGPDCCENEFDADSTQRELRAMGTRHERLQRALEGKVTT